MAWNGQRGKWNASRNAYGRSGYGRGRDTGSVSAQNESVSVQTYTPSVYQAAILEWFRNGTGNAIIQAVAGSGKTSTLVMLAREMRGSDAVFLAFNRSIADELKKKLPANVAAMTFHSLGFRAIRPVLERMNGRPWDFKNGLDDKKVDGLFDRLYGGEETGLNGAKSAVVKLVGFMKHSLMNADATDAELERLISHFDIECDDEGVTDAAIMACARAVLAENNKTTDVIDYNDQLYFVWLFDCSVKNGGMGYQYVMVDECQDTNAARREILRRLMMVRGDSRLVAVGDTRQAIYGFTGADADSMERIRDTFQCVELPLSISYRCAASIVREAQKIVPWIEAREGAEEGKVRGVSQWKVSEWLPTDMVICRNTAPLISAAYKCIRGRVACRVMGRDIGYGLQVLVKKLAGNGRDADSLTRLLRRIEEYRAVETERWNGKKGGESRLASINDKCDSLAMLAECVQDDGSDSVSVLLDMLKRMFEREEGGVLTFSTVHKAKGMEAERVFVLDSGLMPSKYARQEWQQVQEQNLRYVAVTRAKEELVYVESDSIEA